MWPWGHLAFAYLLVSGYGHARRRAAPTDGAAVALGVAALLPDLVDKPLAWAFGVLPSGRSFAHSLFVAVPLVLVALALGRLARRERLAAAFAVAYCSHLAGDVIYPLVVKFDLRIGFLFWPVVPQHGGDTTPVLSHVVHLFADLLAFLATPLGVLYLAFEVAFVAGALALWVSDGVPGLAAVRRALAARRDPAR